MFAAILPFESRRPELDDTTILPLPQSLPRSFGALELQFVRKYGFTRAQRVFQLGVMRARFPNVEPGLPPEGVLINTAGGLTGGDCLNLDVKMGPETQAVLTTQAHEKVYRSVLGDVAVNSRLDLEEDAELEWLPQPTILFDGARLDRQTHVEMTERGSFLGVESVIFGRTAMKEMMLSGALSDLWTIKRDGRLIHADRFAVSGDVALTLAKPAVLAGNVAMATIRYVAKDAGERLENMRALIAEAGSASAWNGMLLARIVAADGYRLGKILTAVLSGFRGRALPSAWSI